MITLGLLPGPPPRPLAGADGPTDHSQAKITLRLLPGPPPTHWQVLTEQQTIPMQRLLW